MYDRKGVEEKIRTYGPDRVWNGEEGLRPSDDKSRKIKIEHCLVRNDGWSLGCTKEQRAGAIALWEGEWDADYVIREKGGKFVMRRTRITRERAKEREHMPTRPKYSLILAEKNNTKNQTKAGAAWVSPEGYISIQLRPGIHISHTDCANLYISLYPIKDGEHSAGSNGGSGIHGASDGDAIPF